MWPSIVTMSIDVDVVCCGDAVGWVMWFMDLLGDCGGLICGDVSVEYDAGACFGIFVWVMCACHVGWTRVEPWRIVWVPWIVCGVGCLLGAVAQS